MMPLPTTYARVLALQLLTLLIMLLASALCGLWFFSATSLPIATQAFAQLRAADALFSATQSNATAHTVPAQQAALSALTMAELIKLGKPPHLSLSLAEQATRQTSTQFFLDKLRGDLARLAGDDADAQLSDAPDQRLWLRSQYQPNLWVGISVTGYRGRVLRVVALLMISAFVISLGAAMLIARVLVRPLVQLAEQSQALVTGARDLPQIGSAPREVRHLADAIARAGARAVYDQRRRESMLTGISHDLRTPLARLRFAVELGDVDDDTRRAAMISDIAEMDDIIADCLGFVRDGSDSFDLNVTPNRDSRAGREKSDSLDLNVTPKRDSPRQALDLAALLQQLIKVSSQSEAWSLITPRHPAIISARPIGLKRALQNLMRNAEVHAQAPFELVISDVRTVRQDLFALANKATGKLSDATNAVLLTISDRGPGIEFDCDNADASFSQRCGSTTGYGLGLSIAEHALLLDGATLTMAKRAGGGLEVRIEFMLS
jgi:two-component system, OmpR family, osmolarity sensor histidine kinase EnvZ